VTDSSGIACGAGSGSESLLNGQYAFLIHGPSVARAGSFTADGTGKITAGEEDSQVFFTGQTDGAIDPAASFYAIGPDHRGCLALATTDGGTAYFRFALGVINASGIATAGHVIEFDDTRFDSAAGTIRLQDKASFVADHFKGRYSMGLIGTGTAPVAIAGTFISDGNSTLSSGTFDIYAQPIVQSDVTATPTGSFTCCTDNGRGELTLQINVPTSFTPPGPTTLAFYMINANDIFLTNSGPVQISGEAVAVPAGTVFSQASLTGASVIREAGDLVDIAIANADGAGAITTNDNINIHGTFTASSSSLHYTVAPNGRVAITGVSNAPVLYLFDQNRGFLVGTDPLQLAFGTIEPQAVGPFSNASLSGGYMFGAEDPFAVQAAASGVVTLDGAGNAAGASDELNSDDLIQNLIQNQSLAAAYSISADGTGNFGTDTTAILISGKKFVFISKISSNPIIIVVEK